MRVVGIALVVIGLGVTLLGVDQADRREGLVALALGLLAPLGVAMCLAGALFVTVPDFLDEDPPMIFVESP